jgi:AraC-like DNA-binding protein/copper chaperone CopZ
MRIYIKHMACVSCKVVVKEALKELNIVPISVELGEVETQGDVSDEDIMMLDKIIKKAGLCVLETTTGTLLEKIRLVMVDYVYHSDDKPQVNFSEMLSKKLNRNYTTLSNFFSEVSATTIEQYIISMRIERVKELLMMEDMSISDIALKMHYSSVSHLSKQFKKITGLTPMHFKKMKEKRRITIQELIN